MHIICARIAVSGLLWATLAGCSDAGPTPQGRTTSALAAPVADVPIDVPSLTCTTAATVGRPEYTLVVRPDALIPSTGLAVLKHFYLVDGQTFVAGYWHVAADASADPSAPRTLVSDASGAFTLDVGGDGVAPLVAMNPFGLPIDLSLTCAPTQEAAKGGSVK